MEDNFTWEPETSIGINGAHKAVTVDFCPAEIQTEVFVAEQYKELSNDSCKTTFVDVQSQEFYVMIHPVYPGCEREPFRSKICDTFFEFGPYSFDEPTSKSSAVEKIAPVIRQFSDSIKKSTSQSNPATLIDRNKQNNGSLDSGGQSAVESTTTEHFLRDVQQTSVEADHYNTLMLTITIAAVVIIVLSALVAFFWRRRRSNENRRLSSHASFCCSTFHESALQGNICHHGDSSSFSNENETLSPHKTHSTKSTSSLTSSYVLTGDGGQYNPVKDPSSGIMNFSRSTFQAVGEDEKLLASAAFKTKIHNKGTGTPACNEDANAGCGPEKKQFSSMPMGNSNEDCGSTFTVWSQSV